MVETRAGTRLSQARVCARRKDRLEDRYLRILDEGVPRVVGVLRLHTVHRVTRWSLERSALRLSSTTEPRGGGAKKLVVTPVTIKLPTCSPCSPISWSVSRFVFRREGLCARRRTADFPAQKNALVHSGLDARNNAEPPTSPGPLASRTVVRFTLCSLLLNSAFSSLLPDFLLSSISPRSASDLTN